MKIFISRRIVLVLFFFPSTPLTTTQDSVTQDGVRVPLIDMVAADVLPQPAATWVSCSNR
jgi:hypothetical protein